MNLYHYQQRTKKNSKTWNRIEAEHSSECIDDVAQWLQGLVNPCDQLLLFNQIATPFMFQNLITSKTMKMVKNNG